MKRPFPLLVMMTCALAWMSTPAHAQATGTSPTPPVAVSTPPADSDLQFVPSEPDFTLAALPTTLRMPVHKLSFRLTHRFARPLNEGSFADSASNLFGFDDGAQIGLELRYGIAPGTDVTFHRTSDQTIQFLGQHEFLQQTKTEPISVDALLGVEGLRNFHGDYSQTLGGIVSHKFADHGAVYAEPMVVFNANVDTVLTTPDIASRNDTFMVGLGTRLRLGKSHTYIVGEYVPRVSGYDPGFNHASFGFEEKVGGHMFQINVSNTFATTMGQIARGALNSKDWYIGFNLTRKFF